MKRVKMILTNAFDPDVRVYKEAKYLVSKGFDVEILCWDREGDYSDREIEVVDGIRIRRFFPYAKYGTGFKQVYPYLQFIKECKNYLKHEKCEYLHCHDLDGTIAGYFSRSKDTKLVFDMHEFYEGQRAKKSLNYIVRQLVNKMHNASEHIIYLNEMQKSVMLDKNKKKLIYIPNYPEIDNYRGSEKTSSDKLRISYIGAVRQYNELKNLMDACRDMDDVLVSIHGNGVAYEGLNAIKGDYKNVNVTGTYHFSDSAKLYSQTDILYAMYPVRTVHDRSGYPIKFFESIITKTPIIVAKGSEMEEFILEHNTGFVVDGSSVEEIRKLVEYINENRNILSEKIANLEKIQYDYSWEEVVKNLDKVYVNGID